MVLEKETLKKLIQENNVVTQDDLKKLLREINKDVIETLLGGEITTHLGYDKHDYSNKKTDNSRNGFSSKKINTSSGSVDLKIPRDRKSEFDPIIIKKYEKDITGIEEKVIAMYSRGMSTRDINDYIKEIYGTEISAETVSNITKCVLERAKEWQSRPLDKMYPIIFLDATIIKMRNEGSVKNTAVYAIIGINLDGKKECLGLWIGTNESSKYWLGILTELKNRGLEDVLIFSVDNLKGISESIEAVFPNAEIQKCIVHQIRNSLAFVSWKERKAIASDLKNIYKAETEEKGFDNLIEFKEKWDKKYPHISASWERNWNELATFYKYPKEIKRLIYTTNPIESFNSGIKKITKNKGSFPSKDAATKLLFLATERVEKKWTQKTKSWGLIFSHLSIYFKEIMEKYI